MKVSPWSSSSTVRETRLRRTRARRSEIAEKNLSQLKKILRELAPIKNARQEKVKDWKIGDRVSNGKRRGTITSINYNTGRLVIRFRVEEPWMPDHIERVEY